MDKLDATSGTTEKLVRWVEFIYFLLYTVHVAA